MKCIKKEEVCVAEFENEDGEASQLKYFKMTYKPPNEEALYYGVCVEKLKNNIILESEESGIVSDDFKFIQNTVEVLKENTVTPYILCEILDEIIS